MPILDQYGNPAYAERKFIAASQQYTRERPWQPISLDDIQKLIPAHDRKVLVSASRRIYANMSEIQGVLTQQAFYSVGRAYLPQFEGKDKAWGDVATDWLQSQWYPIADVMGHDFRQMLYNLVLAYRRDGENAMLLTEYEDGYPALQSIPAHRIGQRDDQEKQVSKGPYRGLKIEDGVICNRLGRPVAYRIMGEDPSKDIDVSARDLIFCMDPEYPEQTRGIPALSSALNMLRDSLTSHQWEQQALLMLSRIGIMEWNEDGGPDPLDPAVALNSSTTSNSQSNFTYETMAGGTIQYFRAGSGSKLETIKHDRTTANWENFQDRILRKAYAALGWSLSIGWKPEGTGVATREELMRAQKTLDDIQDVTDKVAIRAVGYAIAKAQRLGKLPESPEWYKWSFTKPAKMTIDDGRTGKTWIDMWRSGLVNATEYLGAKGIKLETHYRQRAEEVATRKLIAAEVSAATGVEIEEREMAMLTPNEMKEKETPEQEAAEYDS